MKLLVDNQLPIQLSRHLRSWGLDCSHVLDIGLAQSSDAEIWKHAEATNRVVVSKDEDFVFLAKQSGASGRLLWVRLGNCRNDELIAAFDRARTAIVEALNTGQQVIEVR